MSYRETERLLKNGGLVILDGGTGTELERRGVQMDPEAWCGPASLENGDILQAIHQDYIAAGADVITSNTYASSRILLEPAGFADQFGSINRAAIDAARRARDASGRSGILIAGSLSHQGPIVSGTARSDMARAPSEQAMADAFEELAEFLRDQGCDWKPMIS